MNSNIVSLVTPLLISAGVNSLIGVSQSYPWRTIAILSSSGLLTAAIQTTAIKGWTKYNASITALATLAGFGALYLNEPRFEARFAFAPLALAMWKRIALVNTLTQVAINVAVSPKTPSCWNDLAKLTTEETQEFRKTCKEGLFNAYSPIMQILINELFDFHKLKMLKNIEPNLTDEMIRGASYKDIDNLLSFELQRKKRKTSVFDLMDNLALQDVLFARSKDLNLLWKIPFERQIVYAQKTKKKFFSITAKNLTSVNDSLARSFYLQLGAELTIWIHFSLKEQILLNQNLFCPFGLEQHPTHPQTVQEIEDLDNDLSTPFSPLIIYHDYFENVDISKSVRNAFVRKFFTLNLPPIKQFNPYLLPMATTDADVKNYSQEQLKWFCQAAKEGIWKPPVELEPIFNEQFSQLLNHDPIDFSESWSNYFKRILTYYS